MKNQLFRKDYAIIGALMILISIGVTFVYVSFIGKDKLPVQIVRLLLTTVLVIYLSKNKEWAIWTLGIISIGAGIIGIPLFLSFFEISFSLGLGMEILSVFYLLSGIYIIATRKRSILS